MKNCEEDYHSLCEVSDVSVFRLLSLMPWISLLFLKFYFEVCVLIGPYLSLRVSQLNLHLLFEMFIFQRFSLCQKLRVPEADDMLFFDGISGVLVIELTTIRHPR